MISPGAVSAAPSRFLIEAFFVAPDAIPTDVVQTIVLSDRLYDVRSLSVALFATINLAVLAGCHGIS